MPDFTPYLWDLKETEECPYGRCVICGQPYRATEWNREWSGDVQVDIPVGFECGGEVEMIQEKHCDDYIDDPSQPECLRQFLSYKRMPAIEQAKAYGRGEMCPDLYATHQGQRVRVVMASRFGDVGITADLSIDGHGYEKRVFVEQLCDFQERP